MLLAQPRVHRRHCSHPRHRHGANTAIFSLVDAVMLKSLPVRNPSQLFVARWVLAHQRPNVHTSGYGDCGDAGRPKPDSGGCSFYFAMFQKIRRPSPTFSRALPAFAGPGRLEAQRQWPSQPRARRIGFRRLLRDARRRRRTGQNDSTIGRTTQRAFRRRAQLSVLAKKSSAARKTPSVKTIRLNGTLVRDRRRHRSVFISADARKVRRPVGFHSPN